MAIGGIMLVQFYCETIDDIYNILRLSSFLLMYFTHIQGFHEKRLISFNL